MVIGFEEKDRKKIEATGMTIIQVKRVFYTVIDFISDVLKVVKNYYNSLSLEQKEEFLKFYVNKNCQHGCFTDNSRGDVPP